MADEKIINIIAEEVKKSEIIKAIKDDKEFEKKVQQSIKERFFRSLFFYENLCIFKAFVL